MYLSALSGTGKNAAGDYYQKVTISNLYLLPHHYFGRRLF